MASATIERPRGRRRWLGGREGAQRRFVAVVLSPALAYMAVFLLLPIAWAILLAFFDFSSRRTEFPRAG
jgi:ABC-type sugar transport system permease subunit